LLSFGAKFYLAVVKKEYNSKILKNNNNKKRRLKNLCITSVREVEEEVPSLYSFT
jgi:hypothetical protein